MEKKQVSKSKFWLLISVGILVVSIGFSAWMAYLMPREFSYDSKSKNIVDVVLLGSKEWLYATSDGTLEIMTGYDIEGNAYNVAAMAKENYGIEAGVLRQLYKAPDSSYLWCFTSYLDNSGNNRIYLFQLQYAGGDVQLVDYVPFEGNVENTYMVEQDGFLYGVTTGKQVAELFKYDVTNVTAGIVQNTYLYDCSQVNNGVKLTAIRMPNGINCLESDGEYIYILYNAGCIRVSVDFADVKYNSTSSNYLVDSIDPSKYISFGLKGVSSGGGAFVKENGKFYVTDSSVKLYSFDVADIQSLKVGDDIKCETVSDITFKEAPKRGSAIYYEAKTGVGYVLHDSSAAVTKVNLKTGEIDFTFNLEFNIMKIAQGAYEDDIFYLYRNVNKTGESEKTILSYVNVNSRRNQTLTKIGFFVGMTFVLFSAVATTVLAVIVRKKKEEHAKKVWIQIKRQKKIYLMILPSLILLIMFCYYEAVASIVLSFFDYSVDNPTFIWNNFDNYKEVFLSASSVEAFSNMVIFLGFDLVTAIVPPLIFAFFLTMMKSERLSNIVRTLLFITGVVPSIAGMLIWKTGIYGGDGALNFIIKLFGGQPIAFLGQTAYAKWAVLMIGFPFVGAYLIFFGGMMNISKSYYEAAELEGIGIWRRFISIDIPLIFPQLKYVFITSFIASLQNFQRTYMITGGNFGTKTPIHLMYQNMVNGEYGQASAYATVIFVLLFGATYINLRKQKQDLED